MVEPKRVTKFADEIKIIMGEVFIAPEYKETYKKYCSVLSRC